MLPRSLLVPLFVGGAIGGALLDGLHIWGGALHYPQTSFTLGAQPWWVAPQFGIATLLIAAGAWQIAPRAVSDAAPRTAGLLVSIFSFVGIYAASAAFWDDAPRLLTVLGAALWLALLFDPTWRPHRFRVALLGFALMIGGVAYEGTLNALDIFTYQQQDIFFVPIWLPMIYLVGSITLVGTIQRLRASQAERLES